MSRFVPEISATERRPAKHRPRVSVVVPCRDEAAHIEACLSSILAQEGVEGGFEIIVADGASRDGTREILHRVAARTPTVRVIDNPGLIASTGLNAAIRESRGEVIVRMDVHAEYAPDYVATCVDTLERTGAQNVGGPARTKSRTFFQRANALAFHSPFAVGGARFHDPEFEGWVDTVTFGCWSRSTIERLGGFDESLVRNQDDELNLRLVRSGGRIWQSPAILSWYYPRASLAALFRQYAQYGYWKVPVIQKHGAPASLRHLVAGAFVTALIALSALSWPFSWPRPLLTAAVGLYLLTSVVVALVTCRHAGDRALIPVMPLVFAAYHVGYGLGFLLGVLDFLLLRRRGRTTLAQQTR